MISSAPATCKKSISRSWKTISSNPIPAQPKPRWLKWACLSPSGVFRSCRPKSKISKKSAECLNPSACWGRCMLRQQIEQLFDQPPAKYLPAHTALFQSFKDALNAGELRAAQPDDESPWGCRVKGWGKQRILLVFRIGPIAAFSHDPLRRRFFDKSTYPVKHIPAASAVRIVPGGSSIRDGAFIGNRVTRTPTLFVNVGASV